jgi:hypothetical protein
MRARLAVIAALGLAGLAILPATAGAYVYWVDNFERAIGRAGLNGSGADPSFVATGGQGYPAQVAVDRGHLYWATTSGAAVGRANLDGSGVKPSQARLLDRDLRQEDRPRQPRRLSGEPELHHRPQRGALQPGGRRWPHLLDQCLRGRPHDRARFITATGAPTGIAVDAGHIYWANTADGVDADTIGRANLDGSGLDQSFISGATDPIGVAVDAQHVYWTNGPGTIGRANLDGSGIDQSFISGLSTNLFGIAADGLPAPKTTIASVSLDHNKRKATIRFRSSQPTSTFACSLDGKTFSKCSSPGVYRNLAKGRHVFRVKARNSLGATDPSPAKRRFRI